MVATVHRNYRPTTFQNGITSRAALLTANIRVFCASELRWHISLSLQHSVSVHRHRFWDNYKILG
jgi:hypothetical protein